jgi:hypothetical protein
MDLGVPPDVQLNIEEVGTVVEAGEGTGMLSDSNLGDSIASTLI